MTEDNLEFDDAVIALDGASATLRVGDDVVVVTVNARDESGVEKLLSIAVAAVERLQGKVKKEAN